jgi:WD40 repeat protein
VVVGKDNKIYRWSALDNKSVSVDLTYKIRQVQFMQSGKVFFAGLGDENRPGSIQIWRNSTFEKVNEV